MTKQKVPKPVKQQKLPEDKNGIYLKEWKRLFEAIDPEIKVYLHTEKDFPSIRESCYPSDRRMGYRYAYPLMLVCMPVELGFHYLAGLEYDRMFSNDDVHADSMKFTDEDDIDLEPETTEWKKFYLLLCDGVTYIRKNKIPIPPLQSPS